MGVFPQNGGCPLGFPLKQDRTTHPSGALATEANARCLIREFHVPAEEQLRFVKPPYAPDEHPEDPPPLGLCKWSQVFPVRDGSFRVNPGEGKQALLTSLKEAG